MKILEEKVQGVLALSAKPISPSVPNEFNLKLSNIRNNTLIEWMGKIVGRALIKGDIFYLKLNEDAPKLVISDFPLQKQIFLEIANAVEVNCTKRTSVDVLAIDASSIDYRSNTSAAKEISFRAKDTLIVSGSLISEKIQFEASKFVNTNRIEGKETISIDADNIEQSGELESNILLIKSSNLNVHAESQIKTKESSVIIADSVVLKGDLNLGANLFCKVNNLTIANAIEKLSDAYLDTDILHIEEGGKLELDSASSNELKAKKIILDQGSKLKLNQTLISKAEILSQGELELDACKLEIKELALQGHYHINNTKCVIEKQATLQGDPQSTLSNAEFEAEKIDFFGNNNIQSVDFVADNMCLSEGSLSEFNDATFDVLNRILLKEGAKTQLNNTAINSKYLQLLGESSLENCALESDIFVTSAKTNLQCSTILVSDFWQNSGTKIDNCKLKAQSVDFQDQIYINKSDFVAQTLNYKGSGIIDGSKVTVLDHINGSQESDLTFKHSYLETGQSYSQGILNFTEGSYYQSKYTQQSSGTIRVNGSQVKNETLLFTFSGAQLISEAQSKVELQSALFQGDTNWNNSMLSAVGPVLFCGKTTAEKAGIASKDSIYLANDHHFKQSTISSEKDISLTGDLKFENSTLDAKIFNVASQNSQIENSQIAAEDLKILGHFCAKKSLIKLTSALEAFCNSSISLEASKSSAKSMNLWGKMKANLAEFNATDINFKQTSTSDFQNSKLIAVENINNEMKSKITGNALETKSSHLSNHGFIGVDKFSASATTMYNSGEIQSEQLQLKANLGLLNTGHMDSENIKIQSIAFLNAFGSIKSTTSTTIQSPLLLNFCGDLASNGSLSMDSILHCNLGLERAFDFNSRSLINLNYGLVLPNLPASYKDVFTFSRGLSFARMGLSQLLPNYSNVISLGGMAVPYVQKSTRYLYDFYKSDAPLSALPSQLYTSVENSFTEFKNGFAINEASDIFPVMMNTMSTVLSGVQFGKSVIGAFNEVNAACSDQEQESSATNIETSQEETETDQTAKESFNIVDVAGSLSEIAIKALGPSMNIQSVFSHNAGLTASANLTESAVYDSNEGMRAAWNLLGDYSYGVNRGVFAGANVVVTGKTYENLGNFTSLKKASLLFSDSIKNTDGGTLDLSNFHIKTDAFDNAGQADLKKGKLEANTLRSTNEINFSGVAVAVKETASLTGKYTLSDNSTLDAQNLNLENKGLVQQSSIKARENLHQTGDLVSEESTISGKNVTLSGTKATDGKISAENKLLISDSETLGTGLAAKNADLAHSTFRGRKKEENPTPDSAPSTTENNAVSSSADKIMVEEHLKTENVKIENMQVESGSHADLGSTFKESILKIEKDFNAKNSAFDQTFTQAHNIYLSGETKANASHLQAENKIIFEEKGHLRTHDADFEAVNEILHRSNNHEQTGSLLFKAKHVETAASSNLYSGTGENNAFDVQAETGNFQGKMHLDNGSFDVKHLNKVEDLIGQKGQSAQQQFSQSLSVNTEDAVNIENMKPRACNLAVRAKEIRVNTDYKSEHDLSLIATEGNIKINADVKGDKVVLQSEKSDIEVKGKTVEGKTYVHAEAAGDIKVLATEKEFQGKYSREKKYTPANIIGGTGNQDTGGAGVILKAGRKAIIDASNVGAIRKTIVSGDKGVKLKARSHSYISNRKSHTKRCLGFKHGKKKTETTTSRIATSTLSSPGDQVQVISSEGLVTGVAGDFIAAKGTDIYAYGDIKLKSLITETKTRKQEKGCFGLNSKKKTEKHENAKLVDFVSGSDKNNKTRLHSNTGHIYGTDLRFQGAGDVTFETPNGSSYLKSSKLNHSVKIKERKFSISSPAVGSAKNLQDKKRFVQAAEPVLGQAEAFSNAQTNLEKMASASNLAIGAYNTASTVAEGAYAQQLMQGVGFVPKINLSVTEAHSESHYQTGTGTGFFIDGDVNFLARDNVNLEGMPIIADNLGIRANYVRMSGQAYESSHSMTTNSAQVGVSPTGGFTDASMSHSSQKMKVKQYQNMQVQIKNKITIEAASLEMDAANMTCDTIAMKVDKLTIQTRQDELEQSSQSINASTTGNVGMHQSHTESKKVNQTAGIHVRGGIEKGDMQVQEANLIGAAVTADGYNGFEPDKLNITTVKDSSHTSGFGISGNLNSISNAIQSDSDSPSKLTTFSVSHEKREYKAENKATIFGSAGVSESLQLKNPDLNTASANSKQVTRDKAQNIVLDVPVEIVKSSIQSGIQFFKPVERKEDSRQTIFVQQVESPEILSNEAEDIILESDSVSVIEDSSSPTETNIDSIETDQYATTNDPLDQTEIAQSSLFDSDLQLQKIEENQVATTNELLDQTDDLLDQTEIAQPGPFDPDMQTQKLGMKQGRKRQQLCNTENGQYTSLEKEIDISLEKNRVTTNIECVLIEEGDKGDGLYYSAKIDPLASQLIIEGGLGKQVSFNLDTQNMDLGPFGSTAYAIDACSAQALIDAQLELSSKKAAVSANAEIGVMGPSASASYSTPCISFMGITFQILAEGAAGIGLKGDVGLGAQADAAKMKVGFFAKLGFFGGAGASGRLKLEFGIDTTFTEKYEEACKNAVESDLVAQNIIEKLKQGHQEGRWVHLEEWEHDHLNMVMDGVPCFFSN